MLARPSPLLCIGLFFLTQTMHLAALDERPVVRVAYFIPTDRKPEPDHQARLDRVMREVQRFYQAGMEQNGYGKKTFELDRDAKGVLRIYPVQAKGPMRNYGRNSSDAVRREVREALLKQNIDIDRETVIIFQLLLGWQGDKAEEIGSFVGSGGAYSGTAWVYDDAKIDPQLLPSRQPGGYYHGPCSLGQFNTHYLGGIAHELGHTFGLPHDCERSSDHPQYGNSLMGHGNHTYGKEKRGEGKGSFLSAASALPLSVHPLFTGKRLPSAPVTCRFETLKAAHVGNTLQLTGSLKGGPRVIGLVARNDPTEPPGDYEAVGWICKVDASGAFRLAIGELKPGTYDLRVAAYGETGEGRHFTFHYQVDQEKRPDLRPFNKPDGEIALQRPAFLTPERRKQSLLQNADFEKESREWVLRSYRQERAPAQIVSSVAREGKRSLLLQSNNAEGNDIGYVQKVKVKPGTRYLLSGWAKTRDVVVTQSGGNVGANLSIFGRFEHSDTLVGNQGWTYLTLVFDTGTQSEIEVGARLGHNGSVAKGSAWFDDLVLIELTPTKR